MKAISIRQPWASFVAGGDKTVECRTWRCKYRGPLLICSSKGDFPINDGLIAPGGMGLGVVELVDVRPMTRADIKASMLPDVDIEEALKGFAWHIKPIYEAIPFPVKGKLNFFEVDDALIKRLPEGYADHNDYLYQHGVRWKDENDPMTMEEYWEQQGLI